MVNAGTLAHRVLERWIRAEGYGTTDPKAALAQAAYACTAELPAEPPASWRVSRARLLARSSSLVDLIGARTPNEVLSEIELKDEALKLRGQLDLLLVGDEMVVVDLKTQTLQTEELPEYVLFQLTVYAHLVRSTYGRLPARMEVFSLNRGRIQVPLTDDSVRSALDSLAQARAADTLTAHPDSNTCHFCHRRLMCDPHWHAAAGWSNPDAVEGEIERVEMATTGVFAILLLTPSGPAWATGIPANLVSAQPGQQARLVRVRDRRVSSGHVPEWRWSRGSAISVV